MSLIWHRGIPSLSAMWQLFFFVLVGLWPRSAVASLLIAWRNANLAGGFAGRPGCFLCCLVIVFIATACYCTA